MKSQSKRSYEEKIDKDVLDIILVDDTGPIMVSLWGNCVDSFLERKTRMEPDAFPLVSFSALSVTTLQQNDWNGRTLSVIHVSNTVEGRRSVADTEITFISSSPSQFISKGITFQVPRGYACTSNFATVKDNLKAPFRGSFRGSKGVVFIRANESMRSEKR